MKFQNPSFKLFLNGRTHGRTDARTDAQTDKPKAICSQFFQSWRHKKAIERLYTTCKANKAEVHVLCDCLECCIKPHSLPTKMYQTMATTLSDQFQTGKNYKSYDQYR